jgi:hypothetical protein
VLKLIKDKDLVKDVNKNHDEMNGEVENDKDDDKIEWRIDGLAGRSLLNIDDANSGEEKEEGKVSHFLVEHKDQDDDGDDGNDNDRFVFDENDFIQESVISFSQMGGDDDHNVDEEEEEMERDKNDDVSFSLNLSLRQAESNSGLVDKHDSKSHFLPASTSTVSGSFSSKLPPTSHLDANQGETHHDKNDDESVPPLSPSPASVVSSEKEDDDSSFHDEEDQQEEVEEEKEGYEDEDDSLMSCDDDQEGESDSEMEKEEDDDGEAVDTSVPVVVGVEEKKKKGTQTVSLLPSLDEDLDVQLIGHHFSPSSSKKQRHHEPRSLKQDEMEFSNSFHLDDDDGDFVSSFGGKKKRPGNSEVAAREECIRKLKVLTTALKVCFSWFTFSLFLAFSCFSVPSSFLLFLSSLAQFAVFFSLAFFYLFFGTSLSREWIGLIKSNFAHVQKYQLLIIIIEIHLNVMFLLVK